MVERYLVKVEVAGSIPASPAKGRVACRQNKKGGATHSEYLCMQPVPRPHF